MRILYLCPDLGISLDGHKGASAHVRELVRAFSALDHEVLVLTTSTGGNIDIGVPIFPISIPEIHDALSSDSPSRLVRALGHLWNNVVVEQVLREVLPSYKPDIVYERYSPFGVAGAVMGKRMGVPHILEVNAPLALEGKRYRQQALQEVSEFLEQIAFTSASLIVAVSQVLRDELLATNVKASKIVVVPNGVNVDMFSPRGPVYRQGLEGKNVVGFVGSMKAWHGVDLLAEAFRKLSSDLSLHLLIVGDGPMAKVFHSLRDDFPGQVTMVGAVSHTEVPAYIRAMDVAVAPYPQLEPFYFSPLKVLEYMAVGRAVVAANIGQISDIIHEGETGLLVPPGDAGALAQAIRKLFEDPDLRYSLGRRASAEVRRAHTWAQRASEIINLAQALA